MITLQTLKDQRIFEAEVLRTVKNGKAYYFIKLEDTPNFVRISKDVYLSLDSIFQHSFNLLTKIEGQTVRHFKIMSVI